MRAKEEERERARARESESERERKREVERKCDEKKCSSMKRDKARFFFSVLQCIPACCSVLQCFTMRCSVFGVLQFVAVWGKRHNESAHKKFWS